MDWFDEAVRDARDRLVRMEKGRMNQVASLVLGIKLDSWGQVKTVDPKLVEELRDHPITQEAIETLKKATIEQIGKKKWMMKSLVDRVVREIRDAVLEEVVKLLKEEVREIVYQVEREELIRQMKRDPLICKYLTAAEIKKANLRPTGRLKVDQKLGTVPSFNP